MPRAPRGREHSEGSIVARFCLHWNWSQSPLIIKLLHFRLSFLQRKPARLAMCDGLPACGANLYLRARLSFLIRYHWLLTLPTALQIPGRFYLEGKPPSQSGMLCLSDMPLHGPPLFQVCADVAQPRFPVAQAAPISSPTQRRLAPSPGSWGRAGVDLQDVLF